MDLYLRTFGRVELISEGPPRPGLTSGRPLMLLAYLALNPGKPLERAALADLLWGDSRGEGATRRAFRQALYVVRQALPEGSIEADRHHVRLVRAVACDASEFEQALREADAARIASLYQGPFLGGLAADAPPTFEHWAYQQATRYQGRARNVLLEAADNAAAAADPDAAAAFLEALDRMDGFDLSAELRKVEITLRLGQSAIAAEAAQRALDHCAELEISIPPDTRVRLELVAHGPATTPRPARASPP
jgi:DNA-binding SARP family transcriptional activator